LIVDDEINTRQALVRYLRRRFEIDEAEDGEAAIRALQKNDYDLVLTDLRMPGVDGMGVLDAALSKAYSPLCIVFTAYGSVEKAVEAVKKGAFDFLTKPVKLDKLETVIANALESVKKQPVRQSLPAGKELQLPVSEAMRKLDEIIATAAPSRSTVLITGESGSGKEVAAKKLHKLSGRKGLFVPVHCAALPENLLESELFGHEKGAFTGASDMRKGRFELADGGTLFLDEIGEIPLSIQVKLLRVLETKTFERIGSAEPIKCDIRLLAATNRDLKKMVDEGTFREDLYYRLNVVNLEIPPLREHAQDIEHLANAFAAEFAAENGKQTPVFSPEAMQKLKEYPFPGNVRELRNCIERLIVFNSAPVISIEDLPDNIRNSTAEKKSTVLLTNQEQKQLTSDNINDQQHALIIKVLEECGNNRTLAADKLGISRRTLQRRLKEYGINE
ncbi:MAG: sigma-54-dependent Fis family transcriptional regulator, partial [Lentisphaeria bacterium]|nr:sigma-54-dependent Fis family transcriptional regulator [Lentisphaeria bacterium]